MTAFSTILGGQVLSIRISGEGYLGKIGELKTQLDQLKVRYSSKGVVHKSAGVGTDPHNDRAVA